MQTLLSPIIKFLNSISYKSKFILIGLSVVLYTSFLVYQNFSRLHDSIEFSQKELDGANLLPDAKALLVQTQKLRGMTATYLSKNQANSAEITALKGSLEAQLSTFKETFSNTSVKGLDASVSDIMTTLTALNAKALSMDVQSGFDAYTAIVQKELDLIVLVGDNSNLILDPNIDSFYMMDAVVNKLPEVFENSGKLRGLGATILANKTITNAQMAKMMSFQSAVQKDIHAIDGGFDAAYRENPSIKESLEAHKMDMSEKYKHFATSMQSSVITQQNMNASEYFAQGTAVITAGETLYNQSMEVLQSLLTKRVDGLKHEEMMLTIQALAFAIFLAVIFQAFYYSVSGAVLSVVSQLKEIEENKDLSKDIVIDTKDELREIATAYNSFRASIYSTMQAALLSVESSTSNASQMLDESEDIAKNSQEMSSVMASMAKSGEEIKSELVASKELAQNSKEQINVAYETLQSATSSIENLASQVQESSRKEMDMVDKITQLNQDASDVKNVLGVINDIAEQTNLLALNAAIEAARAGEHGRGFAVVADEVRQLAEKTQKSLSEINATINVIMQNIAEASSEMNDNAKDISSMTETSDSVLKEVEWVNTIMDEATKLIEASSVSIEKNALGVEKMAQDLHDTNTLSESNSAKVASISKSSSDLAGKVNDIKERVNTFTL